MPVEAHDRVEPLAAEWDELADEAGALPWLRPTWVQAWSAAFGRGRLQILAFRRDGRLAAVLPLERRFGGLYAASNWHSPDTGIVALDAAAREELADSLLRGPASHVSLAFFAPELGQAELEAAAKKARRRLLVRVQQRSPYVAVDGAWDDYVAGLDRKHVKEVRRLRRRLEEAGEVGFELADGSERFEERFDEWLRLEASGWKGRTGTAVGSDAKILGFYRTIARWLADRGSLRLTLLRLDGRPIACELHVEEAGVLASLKGGYDEELRRFGPGTISAFESLRYAFGRGLESYEFLGGEEPYKLAWATGVRDRLSFVSTSRAPAGLAAYGAYAYGRPLLKRLLRR